MSDQEKQIRYHLQRMRYIGQVAIASKRAIEMRRVIRNIGEDSYQIIKQAAAEIGDDTLHMPYDASLFQLLLDGPPTIEGIEAFDAAHRKAIDAAPKCKAHGNPWYCGHCGKVE